MHKKLGWLLLAVLTLSSGGQVWAGDREIALAVIDKAIQAHGGDEVLVRAQTASRNAAGIISLVGKDVPFADDILLQMPDRCRINLTVGSGREKTRFTLVVNGDKGWQSGGGTVSELGKDRIEEMHEEIYAYSLITLMPLKKDSGFGLAPLAEIKVGDRPAAGVQVTYKGRPEVKLYFDVESGLLVKSERRGWQGGTAVTKEFFFTEHKDFDGMKLATKHIQLVNGKKFSEVTVGAYKFPGQVHETSFAKP